MVEEHAREREHELRSRGRKAWENIWEKVNEEYSQNTKVGEKARNIQTLMRVLEALTPKMIVNNNLINGGEMCSINMVMEDEETIES